MNIKTNNGLKSTQIALSQLDDFDILSELDHAGNSRLFRVVSKRGRLKDRIMVLKVTSTVYTATCMHQSMHHPNIVSLFASFSDLGDHYHTLEYCPLGSLESYLPSFKGSVLEEQDIRSLARSIASALVYLENKQIIHRNIQPRNILISTAQVFKLHNFDDAVYCCDTAREPCRNISLYSAPEVMHQEKHSYAADAWSLGCLLLSAAMGPSNLESYRKDSDGANLAVGRHAHALKDLLVGFLQSLPGHRMTASQALSHHWVKRFPPCEPDESLDETPILEPPALREDVEVIESSIATRLQRAAAVESRKPSLNPTFRRPEGAPLRRSATDPALRNNDLLPTSPPQRSVSERSLRERLVQFFMKPVPHIPCLPLDERDFSGYMFDSLGTITVLPSRCFIIDFRSDTGGEILLVNPATNMVQIHSGSTLKSVSSANPLCLSRPQKEHSILALPSVYDKLYLEALAHLENIKERTPMLTLHLVEGKCMMMCNLPLPDIEILLRFPATSSLSTSKTMFRVRFIRRSNRLEFAQRTSHDDNSSEWIKRLVYTSRNTFPFLLDDDWNSLDDLERQGVQVLGKFLPICNRASELGSQPMGLNDGSAAVATCDEEPTFDSDFTPDFLPDLASSLPPKPAGKPLK